MPNLLFLLYMSIKIDINVVLSTALFKKEDLVFFFPKICLFIAVLLFNTIPYKVVAQEPRSPFVLYHSAIQAAVLTGLYDDCCNSGAELCGEEEAYCMMTKEEKIQAALTGCYEHKLECLVTCANDFAICKDNGGTSAECSPPRVVCDQTCADEGDQCVIRAVNGDYADALSFAECQEIFFTCSHSWIIKCKTFYHR